MAFKEGDIAMLKSGGPHMTVCYVDETNNNINCQWFHESKLDFAEFIPEALENLSEN